jgi:uncharacterized OB-fold protein
MTQRPLPVPSKLTEGFWQAARRHELVVQQCDQCGRLRHYPQYLCPGCRSDAWTWVPVNGTGSIYTYSIAHRAFHPFWADRVPYAVATIELDEGVRMVSDLSAEDTARVAIGLPAEVYYEDVPGTDITLPRFRLSGPAASGAETP